MSGYLSRFKALKSEMPPYEVLTKPTKPPFVSFGSEPEGLFEGETQTTEPVSVTPQTKENAMPECLWRNPYPQGTPEARAESLRVTAASRKGEPI